MCIICVLATLFLSVFRPKGIDVSGSIAAIGFAAVSVLSGLRFVSIWLVAGLENKEVPMAKKIVCSRMFVGATLETVWAVAVGCLVGTLSL